MTINANARLRRAWRGAWAAGRWAWMEAKPFVGLTAFLLLLATSRVWGSAALHFLLGLLGFESPLTVRVFLTLVFGILAVTMYIVACLIPDHNNGTRPAHVRIIWWVVYGVLMLMALGMGLKCLESLVQIPPFPQILALMGDFFTFIILKVREAFW